MKLYFAHGCFCLIPGDRGEQGRGGEGREKPRCVAGAGAGGGDTGMGGSGLGHWEEGAVPSWVSHPKLAGLSTTSKPGQHRPWAGTQSLG